MFELLEKQGVAPSLLNDVRRFRKEYPVNPAYAYRVLPPSYLYYGHRLWEMAITALLSGQNILLAGPKATGKNVFAQSLAYLFGRPVWTVAFHINADGESLIGQDTLQNDRVVLRKGPILNIAENGGFGILDEINMAKNEALSILHACLDHRRLIDVPGYDLIQLDPASRFIGTMNYGYAGTRDLNEALLSRFLVIQMPKVDDQTLDQILQAHYPLSKEGRHLFSRLFLDLQEKSLHSEISSKVVDLRGLLSAIEAVSRGLPVRQALEMGIINKSFDTFEKQMVNDIVKSLFLPHLTRAELFDE